MGSRSGSCAKWSGTRAGTRIGRALLEGSGSDAPQHTRTLHAALERTHRARSWLRTVARRSVGRRSRQVNASQERTCRSERKVRMNSTKSISSAQARRTQPEEFDFVILGGGTRSTIAAWTFAGERKQVASRPFRVACDPPAPQFGAEASSYIGQQNQRRVNCLSRQRPRVRVPSSPPFTPKELHEFR